MEEGPVETVLQDPRHPYTVGLLRCIPRGGVRKDHGRLDTIPGFLPAARRRAPGLRLRRPLRARRRALPRRGAAATRSCPPGTRAGAGTTNGHADLPREEAADLDLPRVDRAQPPLVELDELTKVFKQRGTRCTRSPSVSAAIWPGETLGLVGESGSGKTTLARTLLGIVPPTIGRRRPSTGRRLPERYQKRSRKELRALQIVFQNPDSALNRRHSVRRILLRSLTQARRSQRPRGRGSGCWTSTSRVRITERTLTQKPVQLSGGLKQRVAIARAFAGDPKLVVCDEPTSALDVSVQAAILNLLVELQAEQRVAYVFISHDLGVVRYISDRIAVLYLGRLQELGPADVVFDGPAPPVHGGAALGGAHDRRRRTRPDQARGRHPERRLAAVGLRLPHALPALPRRDLRAGGAAARRGRGRPLDALPHPDRGAAPTSGEDRPCGSEPQSGFTAGGWWSAMKIRGVVLEQTGGPLTVSELDLAPPGPEEVLVRLRRERSVPLRLERRRRDRGDPLSGSARPRRRGRRRGRRRRRHPGRRRRSRRPLLDALVRCVRGVRARSPATVLDRVAGDGDGRVDGRDAAALPRRRARLPLFLPLHVRGRLRRSRAFVRPDRRATSPSTSPRSSAAPCRRASARCGAPQACRPGDRVAVVGCGGVGLSALMAAVAVGAEPVVAVDAAPQKLEVARSFGATDAVEWQGSAEATAEAVRKASGGGVDYAIEATGRPEAMEAAFLSTRKRGAAVLIGIPRADAVLSLPATTIPRMERRVLGSIYGSSKPERDFPDTLDLYRERTASNRPSRVPSTAARGGGARIRADALGRGAAGGARTVNVGRARWADRRGLERRGAERLAREHRAREARKPHCGGGDLHARPPQPRPHAGSRLRRARPSRNTSRSGRRR